MCDLLRLLVVLQLLAVVNLQEVKNLSALEKMLQGLLHVLLARAG